MAEVVTQCDCGQLPAQIDDARAMDLITQVLSGQEWSSDTAPEIAEIVQLTGREIREPLEDGCDACGAEPGEECRPDCIGQAADLTEPEAHVFSAEPDPVYAHLSRAHCSCGWHSSGYGRPELAEIWWQRHAAEVAYFASAAPQ